MVLGHLTDICLIWQLDLAKSYLHQDRFDEQTTSSRQSTISRLGRTCLYS